MKSNLVGCMQDVLKLTMW